MITSLKEVPDEILWNELQGLQALKTNQFFNKFMELLDKEVKQNSATIESGEFPEGSGDLQGILNFHQLIGENRGIKRISKVLDATIAMLADELQSRKPQDTNETSNPV